MSATRAMDTLDRLEPDPVQEHVSYRELLDHLSEGVYFTDADRRILFWNRGAQAISGYAPGEMVGRHCWDNILAHVDFEGRALCTTDHCPLVAAMRSGQPRVTEAFLRHRQGHRIPVLIRSMPIRNPEGRIVGAVETFSDLSAQMAERRTIRELESLALLDPLTGLSNRRHLDSVFHTRLEEFRRHGQGMGAILMDVDRFKTINDSFGHGVGDEALRVVARTLLSNTRAGDTAGRWGGDEFLVLCSWVDAESLRAIAERYRILIGHSRVKTENRAHRLSVSMGATLAVVEDTPATIMERVDALLYQSKADGRNRLTMDD